MYKWKMWGRNMGERRNGDEDMKRIKKGNGWWRCGINYFPWQTLHMC
jgi:hypothetical protein